MQRKEDSIGAQEGDPEMNLPHGNVQHPPCHLGIPMIYSPEDDQDRCHAHHHVKMGDHEHGVRQWHIDDHVAKEQAGNAAIHESDDEGQGKQHGQRQFDIAAPQR